MSFSYSATGQVIYVQLSNMPRNIHTGYGETNMGGRVYYSDGSFLLYYAVDMEYITAPATQITANHSVSFSEIPCDRFGNVLMESCWISGVNGYTSAQKMYVMMRMRQEPTHRVNMTTGSLLNNNDDNNYLRGATLSYQIAGKE